MYIKNISPTLLTLPKLNITIGSQQEITIDNIQQSLLYDNIDEIINNINLGVLILLDDELIQIEDITYIVRMLSSMNTSYIVNITETPLVLVNIGTILQPGVRVPIINIGKEHLYKNLEEIISKINLNQIQILDFNKNIVSDISSIIRYMSGFALTYNTPMTSVDGLSNVINNILNSLNYNNFTI